MGYTPDLVVGAWMAHTGNNPDGSPIGPFPLPGQFGVTTASHMVEDFMRAYYVNGHAIPAFAKPAGIQTPAPPRGRRDHQTPPGQASSRTRRRASRRTRQPGQQQIQQQAFVPSPQPSASPGNPRQQPTTCSGQSDIKIDGT